MLPRLNVTWIGVTSGSCHSPRGPCCVVVANPAGGAAIGQIVIATAVASVATAILHARALGSSQPPGPRSAACAALADVLRAASPACPAGPRCRSASPAVSLLIALLGMYWDISLHIDHGRDPGPLANPAHYFILIGLFGIFTAGVLAIVLPERAARPGRGADHARLVRAGRRRADRRLRRLRAARLPARRRLAPDLRPGRHAVGPDAPDADRRRRRCRWSALAVLHRRGPAARGARRGRAGAPPYAGLRAARRVAITGGLPHRRSRPSRASSTSASRSSGSSSSPS